MTALLAWPLVVEGAEAPSRHPAPGRGVSTAGLVLAVLVTMVAVPALLITPADGGPIQIDALAAPADAPRPATTAGPTTDPPDPDPVGSNPSEPSTTVARPAATDPTGAPTTTAAAPATTAGAGDPPATDPAPTAADATWEPAVSEEPAPTGPPPTVEPPTTAPPPPATVAPPPPEPPPVEPEPAAPGEPTAAQWAALRACEAGGDYTAVSPGGQYHGAYQFAPGTWDDLAVLVGRAELVGVLPSAAPPATQDAMALELWRASGPGQWPSCGHLLADDA